MAEKRETPDRFNNRDNGPAADQRKTPRTRTKLAEVSKYRHNPPRERPDDKTYMALREYTF